MKKLLLLGCCLFITGLVKAEDWKTANSVTLTWDAVARISDSDVIKYQVYITSNVAEPTGSLSGVAVGDETEATEKVISFQSEGRYYLGVESIRYPQGGSFGIKSEKISWSNDPDVCSNGNTFGVIYYTQPASVGGLRVGSIK